MTFVKAKLLIATILLAFVCAVASAQSYHIRVTNNTNLRASYSLDSAVLASAPAGATLHVVGQHGRWLNISRDGRSYWMADWVGYTRAELTAPAQTQPVANIDNCCFVARQCNSDQEWENGWWAYQSDRCGGRAQASSQPANSQSGQTDNCCFIGWQCNADSDWQRGYRAFQDNQCDIAERHAEQPVVIPAGVDNCCFVNRQCNTDAEWVSGWQVFQHFQCVVPPATQGISIQGSPDFVAQVSAALRLLRDRAPQWWKYATSGLNTIKMAPEGSGSGVYTETKTYQETLSEVLKDGTGEAGLVYVIFGIVHEACHVNDGHRYHQAVEEEKACMQASLYALQTINPAEDAGTIEWIKWIIANIYDPEIQWW